MRRLEGGGDSQFPATKELTCRKYMYVCNGPSVAFTCQMQFRLPDQ
jgi:hypothetical protein